MKIGFVGLGRMGTPMALRLLARGHELAVWNRTEERVKPLIHEGAIAAATPAEAELGAEAVVTMLPDDAAYEEVLFGVHRMIDALSPGVLHVACGGVSSAFCRRMSLEHSARGTALVGAKVFGTPPDAAEGRLWTAAAGELSALDRARPLLAAFSREIVVAGIDPCEAFAVTSAGAGAA